MKTLLPLHELPDLKTLSGEQKDALIEQLWQEHQALQKVLAGRGKSPKKTAENSSLPPSKGFKKNQPAQIEGVKRQASVGRAGGGRALQPQPHQTIVVQAAVEAHIKQQFQIQNLTVLKPLQQLGFMILNISTDR